MNAVKDTYNGYANYETWNVVLWLQNDEQLNKIAMSCGTYDIFKWAISQVVPPYHAEISVQTPDEVLWNDKAIAVSEVNQAVWGNQ